jgi:hypothetical protein
MRYQYEPLADEYEFQSFLKDLFNAKFDTNSFEEYGSRGHSQFGVDIYSPGLRIAIQAKKKDINRTKQSLVRELSIDLKKTINLIEKFPHEIKHLYFATTTSKNACLAFCSEKECKLQFLSWNDIQEDIAKFSTIRNRYFPSLKENNVDEKSINFETQEQLKLLQQFILNHIGDAKTKKKEYRNIPNCEILLPPLGLELQKHLTAFILKTAAIQNFAETEYKNFTCLLNYSSSFTQFSDGTSGLGFSIICGEVKFLGSCTRLVKMLQNNRGKFYKLYEQSLTDPNFGQINFRIELLPAEGLTAYEFEIDGQTGFYNLRPCKLKPLNYEKLDSLNAVLPFIASTTKFGINIIELDKLNNYPAFTKFVYSMIYEDKFTPSDIKVNVNDFDDWDYAYNIPINH